MAQNNDGAPLTYRSAGVDIHKGDEVADAAGRLARSTLTPWVVSGVGGFAGLFRFDPARYPEPVMAACTDGVGTKLLVALAAGRHDTIGVDLVAMNVNDLIVCGAEPLAFLDYFATGGLDAAQAEAVLTGIAGGCRQAGCALIGGETAEMPGMYPPGKYDLAGFAVGVVNRPDIINGSRVSAGDTIIGLPSSGLHSNGYSLARKIVFERLGLQAGSIWFDGKTAGELLLAPTRIYVRTVLELIRKVPVHAMAHITGGGLPGNLIRAFPQGLSARVRRGAWRPPEIFLRLQEAGSVPAPDLWDTFNMGIGYCFVVPAAAADAAISALSGLGEQPILIGEVFASPGEPRVEFDPPLGP
ncbi:MAG: Phosphoribosylformylglycinamidine cyclo-ligase [Myxococcota bacterium]|nr:Phosphoribosylformylglycinamidine cyclo-ligase [Myxococcota bacterium]